MRKEQLAASAGPEQALEKSQGENHGPEIPGQRFLEKKEIEEESGRLRELRTWAKRHKKELLLSLPIIGGVAVVTIGSVWMVKRLKETGFWVDITERKNKKENMVE